MPETVAILKLEKDWCAFNLNDEVHAQAFIDEVQTLTDHALPDEEAPISVEIAIKPDGWVSSLPEFTGW